MKAHNAAVEIKEEPDGRFFILRKAFSFMKYLVYLCVPFVRKGEQKTELKEFLIYKVYLLCLAVRKEKDIRLLLTRERSV